MDSQKAQLILLTGLPGSGKTYFATRLADRIEAIHYNSDKVRKSLTSDPSYSPDDKQAIYDRMYESVCEDLRNGEKVVVDATFSKELYRRPYLDFAASKDIPLHIIYLHAEESVIKERVNKKREDSDADFAVYQKIKEEYEVIEEPHLTLRTDHLDIEQNLSKAEAYLNQIATDHD